MKMKTLFLCASVVFIAAMPLAAQNSNNGFPSGDHYTLNIQGKLNCAGSDLTGSDRHTIQVLLNFSSDPNDYLIDKTNKILLQPGPPLSQPQVLDGNACDKGGAMFQLPIDVTTTWTAYARALSKPSTSMNITSCGLDTVDNTVICSGTPLKLERKSGKPVTIDATHELLYLCYGSTADNCAGGTYVSLFSDTNYCISGTSTISVCAMRRSVFIQSNVTLLVSNCSGGL